MWLEGSWVCHVEVGCFIVDWEGLEHGVGNVGGSEGSYLRVRPFTSLIG